MPAFDVACDKHGKFEIISSFTAHFGCPSCGGSAKRLWTKDHIKIKLDFITGWDAGAGRNFYSAMDRNNFLSEKGWTRIRD